MRNLPRLIRSPLFLMALVIFVDFTGFGLLLPLLPFWAERAGAGPAQIGLLMAVYALVQLLFTPMLGALSDRVGRKPVILFSLLIEAASFVLTGLAGTLPLLFVARGISGLGASNIGSAQAVVADTTPPARRAQAMGAIGAAIGLGFVVGPALGGTLAALGPAAPFWVAAAVALVNALLVALFLPETRRAGSAGPAAGIARHALFAGWGRALRNPTVARLVTVNLLFTIAFTAMETVYPLLTQRLFNWNARQNGFIFTYVGIVIVIMQGGMVGRLVKRFGERALLLAGLALLAVGLALLPFSTQLGLMLAGLSLLSIGDGAVTPVISTLLSFAAPADAQGETLGVAQSVGSLGRLIGPLAAGDLFALVAWGPFVAGAGLVVLALLLALPRLARHVGDLPHATVTPAADQPVAAVADHAG
jgi:multidrug resistance protein